MPTENQPRRRFLQQTALGLTGLATTSLPKILSESRTSIPSPPSDPDETYWEMIKGQFAFAPGKMMVNAANLCPSPYMVYDKVFELARDLESDVSFQNRAKFGSLREDAIAALANYVGCYPDEVAIARNTSEGNNIVVNGIDLGRGDEVLVWEQNHPSAGVAWEERAKREGFRCRQFKVPVQPQSHADLFGAVIDQFRDETRVLAFSHISNVSGIVMPASDICKAARERGILTMVDGAQSFGAIAIDLHAMGCDFYTGSAHKWLLGPKETGLLFVRADRREQIHPSIISAGWDEQIDSIHDKVGHLGQRNDALVSALLEAVRFHTTIGKEQVERRVRQLSDHLMRSIAEAQPDITYVTPAEPALRAGVVILAFEEEKARSLFEQLYADYGIACAPSGGLRFSPHIYNTLADMDKIVDALQELTA